MRIGFTYDLKTDWSLGAGEPHDANAEFDKPQTVELVCRALESGGHSVKKIGNVLNLLSQLSQLDVDLVFNICEGRQGRNRESQVPLVLEMNNIPFVGSDALTLGMTLDKTVAKKCFLADGIPTAAFAIVRDEEDLEKCRPLGFPLMVKTIWEGSSKGISEASRVENFEALKRQVDFIHSTYHQPALVEQFIRGTEYTVAVLGNRNPEAMPVVQVSLNGSVEMGDEIYTYERIYSDALQYVCPARLSETQARRMQQIAVAAYQSVGCRDFGRVDFRADEQGEPYVLEINPLPALGADDIFNVFPQCIGSTHAAVINRIVTFAVERYDHVLISAH